VLPEFWFGTIAVLWAGYVLLEGFDFGVALLLPVLARDDEDRRVVLRTIGPVWDGNEVWLLVAGGATFAAFPEWYASLFSGFYLPLLLILLGLIVRAIGLEYRSKAATAQGRAWCDRAATGGSLLPAVLLGVALSDWVRGVRMDSTHHVLDGFWQLVTPYALLGGVATFLLFTFHGAVFLALRTTGELRERSLHAARRIGPVFVLVAAGWLAWSLGHRGGVVAVLVAAGAAAGSVAALLALRQDREGWAFAGTAVTSLLLPVFVFACIYPDVLPGRGTPGLSLSDAASSPYTLKVMTVVAVVVTPVVLAYQAWTYWVFRQRVVGPSASAAPVVPARAGA
jgi:cytochrome d ubiquinol oxidase subunit II